MIIRSNNSEIEKELRALTQLVVNNSGWIHPSLSIACNDAAGLSVYMEGDCPPTDLIIKVPGDLLIPADSMNLSVRGSEFLVEPDTDNLSPVQLEIIEHMVSLFNLANKVEFHRNECPWIRFSEAPELMEWLLQARTSTGNWKNKLAFMRGKHRKTSLDEFVAKTFKSTRVLSYQGKWVFIPVVDYMNHDYRGSMFFPFGNDKTSRGFHIQNCQPFASSRECYVFYGVYDGLDMFLYYGFYDQQPPFIRSVPLDIPVQGFCKIIIHSYTNIENKAELPAQSADLQKFMPSIRRMEDGNIEISHLFITVGQFPHALRRVLMLVISTLSDKGITRKQVVEQAKNAEELIVGTNIDFYKSLLRKLEGNTASPALVSEIQQLVQFQLDKIHEYQFDDGFYVKAAGSTDVVKNEV